MKKGAIDLTDLARGIAILGIVGSIDEKNVLRNFTRLQIVDEIAKENSPISLMELSRRIDSSKTNVEHHLNILTNPSFKIIYKKKSSNKLHNPLEIELHRVLKKKLNEKLK